MSKDLKPKRKLGRPRASRRRKLITWGVVLAACVAGAYAAYHYTGTTEVDVAVARVRRGDFIIAVKNRGEIRSTHSMLLTAPQVPDPRIVKLADSGKPIKKGDVVIEFDGVQQEQNLIEKTTTVRTADSEIVQTKAQHKIENEMDGMNLMQSEYNVDRAKLEASKAEILSEIEGAKDRIDVGVSEGELNQVKTSIKSREICTRVTASGSVRRSRRLCGVEDWVEVNCRRWCFRGRMAGLWNFFRIFAQVG